MDSKGRALVLVIGAGPSGLVAAKTLLENGFRVRLVESSGKVGGTFRNKSYDDGRLVSSKQITCFSDFRMGADVDDHPLITDYIEYLERYCSEFKLWPHIQFNTRLERLDKMRSKKGGRVVGYRARLVGCGPRNEGKVSVEDYDLVSICTGLHHNPHVPEIPGLADFRGKVLHSSAYKSKEMFRDRRVLVVGCGETGLDIVYRAIQRTEHVTLCVRSGFLSVPYLLEGLPLDTLITNLFECTHLHPLLERWKIKWKITTPFIRLGFLLSSGSSCGFNQWAGCKPSHLVRRGHLIINKSTQAMPFINRAPKRRSWLGRTLYRDRKPEGELADREVDVRRGIRCVRDTSVEFADGTVREIDMIVLATGYHVRFPFLDNDALPPERNIASPDEPTLSYIGFVRPNVGAIPPMSEMQVMWWISKLRGTLRSPLAPPTYRLLGPCARTGAYAVDYGAYMHDLARDMELVPSVTRLACQSRKTLVAWALGQAYVTFFRQRRGTPFYFSGARQICETELFDPVVRRPFAANAVFIAFFFVFALLNVVAWIISPVVTATGYVWGRCAGTTAKQRQCTEQRR